MKRRSSFQVAFEYVLMVVSLTWATPKPSKASPQPVPPFPGTLVNSRYVYVTSYDGDQFNTNLFPDDRQAIATVQDALQKWGKFTLVYQAESGRHRADGHQPPVGRYSRGL